MFAAPRRSEIELALQTGLDDLHVEQPQKAAAERAQGTVSGEGEDTLAYSAAAGDVNRDGRTDLVINEMLGNGSAPAAKDVGNLLVISGRALPSPSIFTDGFESGDVARWGLLVP